MRIVFAGTPDFAAFHLKTLILGGAEIVAVFSQPDRPSGRGHCIEPTPVRAVATEYGIPVYQPEKLRNNPDVIQKLNDLSPDLVIVVAYGQLIPDEFLAVPRIGTINVHGSLLPRWRGAAPIQRALWNGDKKTGITIMKVGTELDAGDILVTREIPIEDNDTSASLYTKLQKLGAETLLSVIPDIERLYENSIPQNSGLVTYAKKLTREEGILNFNESAEHLERYIRAYQPWPVASFSLSGTKIKIFHADCIGNENSDNAVPGTILSATRDGLCIQTGAGILRITELQLPGKNRVAFSQLINSKKQFFAPGQTVDNRHEQL